MSIYSDQIDVVLRDRLIPKMHAVSQDMATVEQYSYGSSQLLSLKRKSDYYSIIYDFLKEYLEGSEQIDNDKLINIVKLLENPDGERKDTDYLGTLPEKKAKFRSGYTMYINGIEVTPETDIIPGSVITIVIVYGSTRNITGNKTLEITSGTLDQVTDGFTIVLQNMVIPLSLDGTFLEINAQANENGTPLDGGHLFRIPIGDVLNLTGTIILTTTRTGLFTMALIGVGTTTIDWGDGSSIETVILPTGNITHTYITVGGIITITTGFDFTSLSASYQYITDAIVPATFNKIETINLSGNSISIFNTHIEWIKLKLLSLGQNNISIVNTYPEWTELLTLIVGTNPITVLNTYVEWTKLQALVANGTDISVLNTFPEWTQLMTLQVGSSNLTQLDTFPEWTNLVELSVQAESGITNVNTYAEWVNIEYLYITDCPVVNIDTFPTWTKLSYLIVSSNSLVALVTYPEWILLSIFTADHNQIVSIDTYPEWTRLSWLGLGDNPLIYFNTYKEWSAIQYVSAVNCDLTNINDVLIQLDASPIGNTGRIYLDGGTNMGPFGLGLVAKASLNSKGIVAQLTTNTETFMSDIQGNHYAYRTMGTQIWMVENLQQTVYADNTPIANNTLSADWIADLPIYGASDYFLPSSDELVEMWSQLHHHGVGGFTEGAQYWTSTEFAAEYAYRVRFDAGSSSLFSGLKSDLLYVRACRKFIVPIAYYNREVGPGGGLIFKSTNNMDGTWTVYEAAPSDQSTSKAWSNVIDVSIGTTGSAIGTGQANTTAILNQSGGANDWFMPSETEVSDMKSQLYAYSVGDFTGGIYLTSYEIGGNGAMGWNFTGGGGGIYCAKADPFLVRPARSYITVGTHPLTRSVGPAGGLIFATIDNLDGTWTNYEAAPADLASTYAWSNITTVAVGTTLQAVGAGKQNTIDIIAQLGHITSAALECVNFSNTFAFADGAAKLADDLVTTGDGGSYVWARNDIANKDIYGALYNGAAILNPKGIAPVGWHIPTKVEFDTLIAYLGGSGVAGGNLKEMGRWRWITDNVGAVNISRFTAGPAGLRTETGSFISPGGAAFFISQTTGVGIDDIYGVALSGSDTSASVQRSYLLYGQSLRLIKD